MPHRSAHASCGAFKWAIEFVLCWEGRYVNHPDDPGGETNFGIAQRGHPEVDIAGLTREKALAIYRADYWDRLGLDEFSPAIAAVLMDTAVNLGRSGAVKILQRAINDLGARPALAVDGGLGPCTRTALHKATRGRWAALALAQRMLILRAARYAELAAEPGLRGFMRGWLNRATALGDFILQPNEEERP